MTFDFLFRIHWAQNGVSASLNGILLPNPNEKVHICTHSIYIFKILFVNIFHRAALHLRHWQWRGEG